MSSSNPPSGVDATAVSRIVGPTLDKIIKSAPWRKHTQLVSSSKSSLDLLHSPPPPSPSSSTSSSDLALVSPLLAVPPSVSDAILSSLLLALDSSSPRLIDPALDCLIQLTSQRLLSAEVNSNSSVILSKVFESVINLSKIEDDAVELMMLKFFLTAVRSELVLIRGEMLVQIVKSCYNVYLGSQALLNQLLAKLVLAQILKIVYARVEANEMDMKVKTVEAVDMLDLSERSLQDSNLMQTAQGFIDEAMSLNGNGGGNGEVKLDFLGQGEESKIREDGIFLFKNMCKFSMKFAGLDEPEDPLLLRGKVLSLELLKMIIEGAGSIWRTNDKMAKNLIPTLCYYDGELVIDEQLSAKYVGGVHKPAKVRNGCKFNELKESIYKTTKINPLEYDIELVCNWPTDSGSKATNINDDEDVEIMFSAAKKTIELFVVKNRKVSVEEPIPSPVVSSGIADYTEMLETVNTSHGLVSPSYSQPYMNATYYGQQHFNVGFSPYTSYQHPTQYSYHYPTQHGYPYTSPSYVPHQATPQNSGEPSNIRMSHPVYPTPSELYHMTQTLHATPTQSSVGPSNIARPIIDNDDVDMEIDMDVDENEDEPIADTAPLNSLDVVNLNANDRTWMDSMQVNNEPLNFDFPVDDELNSDSDEPEMEVPLDDDLCNAQLMARSIVANIQFNGEIFSSACVQSGFKVGMVFETKEKFLHQLSEWSILRAVSFKQVKSNKTKYTAICNVDENCPWRIHAIVSKRSHSGWWEIRKYSGDHNCVNPTVNSNHKQATCNFLVTKIMPFVKADLDITAGTVQVLVQEQLFIKISYMKAWRALSKALEKIYGDWAESYAALPQYFEEIKRTNPGTVAHVVPNRYGVFDAAFWAFGPCIEGFLHCRPLLCIDGTHLYGKYKGTLLVATAIDADDRLFPLAYGIVDSETQENWGWFFSCMRRFIHSVRGRHITFISDRMKGIPRALQEKWDETFKQRFCARHIKANFQAAGFRDKRLSGLFYAAACASEEVEYNKIREEIKAINSRAHDWIETSLRGREEYWALCKDDGSRFHVMTTNASESFNGVLKGARSLPVKALVARTFFRSVDYFYKRREIAKKLTTKLTPKWEAKIAERAIEARHSRLVRFSHIEWQVVHSFGVEYKVIIDGNTCSCTCNIPLLQKIPCTHVMAACSASMHGANRAHHDFASPWYSVEKYLAAYTFEFHPVRDRRYWSTYTGPILLPPNVKRPPGRPRSTRIKGTMDEMQGRRTNRCSKCGNPGHKKSRCTSVT